MNSSFWLWLDSLQKKVYSEGKAGSFDYMASCIAEEIRGKTLLALPNILALCLLVDEAEETEAPTIPRACPRPSEKRWEVRWWREARGEASLGVGGRL